MIYKYQNFFKILIYFSVLIIIINFFYFVKEQSLNQYSDWLINYQGGFVRRGLIGEIFFQLHKISLVRLDIIVFLFVSFFYFIFYKNFLNLVEKLNFNFINLLIIFSPFSFIYPVMEEKASGRKDIIYLFFLTYLCLYLKKFKFNYQKYLIIFLIAITILSHTGFIFLVPFYITVFFLLNKNQKIKILLKELFIISFVTTLICLYIFLNKNIDDEGVKLICESVSRYVRSDCANSGYISTLSWSLEYNLKLKNDLWMTENYNLFYSMVFLIFFSPLLYVFNFSYFEKFQKLKILYPALILIFLTLPLYYLGVDYGRYMHLTYLSLAIIYFFSLKEKLIISKPLRLNKNKKFNPAIIVIAIFLYGFTFTIPHCCDNNLKFNYKKLVIKLTKN